MHKKVAGTLVIMAAVMISGCTNMKTEAAHSKTEQLEQEEADNIFARMPEYFSFSSGVGAWSTEITISEEGFLKEFTMTAIWEIPGRNIRMEQCIYVNLTVSFRNLLR